MVSRIIVFLTAIPLIEVPLVPVLVLVSFISTVAVAFIQLVAVVVSVLLLIRRGRLGVPVFRF